MRAKNSLKNIAVSLGGQAISFVLAIVSRAVLAKMLPAQYLGVNSLFSNILNVLSLAEMGIGVAMIYALYIPVAIEDKKHIQRLINLYGKMYRLVALVVAVIGLLLIPFLKHLIKDAASVENLVIIYLLYLTQSVSSYLFIYKTSVITAHQKNYVIDYYTYGFNLGMRILQIVSLVITKNFMVYLVVYIVCTILPNFFASWKAEKMYPYIKEDKKLLPTKEEQKLIFENIRACFLHKLGGVAVYNTDNLIMSSFLGLVSVGAYGNYTLISTTITGICNKIFDACSASIGNLMAVESKEHVKEVFNIFLFANYLMFGYFSVGMVAVFRPFIIFTYGEEFLISNATMYLLISCFYLDGMRQVVNHFRDAFGIFKEDKWRVIPEVVMNLVVSIILVKQIGMAGIILGTLISELAFPVWCEPFYLFKCAFKNTKMMWNYFGTFTIRTLLLVGIMYIIRLITDCLADGSFWMILIKGIIATVIYAVLMFVIFGRRKEFKGMIQMIKEGLGRK